MRKILVSFMAAALLCTSVSAYAAGNGTAGMGGQEAQDQVNFLMVDEPCLEPGEAQEIVVSVGGEETLVTSAVLGWHSENGGTSCETEAAQIEGGALLFEIDCPEYGEEDVVLIDSLTYEISGTSDTVIFSEIGIDAKYGVGVSVETDPDGWLVDEDAEYEAGVVTYGMEDILTSAGMISEAISEEQAQIPATMAVGLAASQNVVVVLDPGHDTTHTGAQYGGLSEETLNLKIAQYCKEELETYSGVEVYMTRTTEECPFPGSSSANDLAGRVDYAESVGADVYVSLHLNANDNTSASGSQIYCPNKNYNSSISEEGFELADLIMEELTDLGLDNRGVYSVDSSDTKYPDGSAADYYAVIRRSKLAGFPGIIVEHAFMSNSSDLTNYLSSEESLKALGVADASGIANYFNLTKSNLKKDGDDVVYEEDGETDYTFTGLVNNAGEYWYFVDGVADFTYTGFVEFEGEKWYVEDGKVPLDKCSVIKDKTGAVGESGTWYYVVNGVVRTDFTGLADYKNSYGWWYIRDGVVDFSVNTIAKNKNGWWYVADGKVDFSYNGFGENEYGLWYCEDGKVTFEMNGVLKDKIGAIGEEGTWYYVVESKVQTGYTGVADYKNSNGWWYIRNGAVDFTANTIAKNKNGWWYVTGGKVDFSYNGFGENEKGLWYCEDGKVTFEMNSVLKDKTGAIGEEGTWYYVVESKVQTGYTGVADYKNSNGWWYISNGAVDFTANTIAKNKNGWWYVTGGKVDFSYTGFGENEKGQWYCEDGKVTFKMNGVLKDNTGAIGDAGDWYYVVESKVQTDYTGIADYKNSYGWWYVDGGKVDFSYTGAAQNVYGWWYVKDGKVDFTYNGTVTVSGSECLVEDGKLVSLAS